MIYLCFNLYLQAHSSVFCLYSLPIPWHNLLSEWKFWDIFCVRNTVLGINQLAWLLYYNCSDFHPRQWGLCFTKNAFRPLLLPFVDQFLPIYLVCTSPACSAVIGKSLDCITIAARGMWRCTCQANWANQKCIELKQVGPYSFLSPHFLTVVFLTSPTAAFPYIFLQWGSELFSNWLKYSLQKSLKTFPLVSMERNTPQLPLTFPLNASGVSFLSLWIMTKFFFKTYLEGSNWKPAT